jgi:hypothetical protein
MIYLTPHQGLGSQYDNRAVCDELKALLVNNTAFTWIRNHDQSHNGREVKYLLLHYEGTTKQKKVAYDMIRSATYQGERKNWAFESYYHAHQEAHYNLKLHG